MKFFSRSSRATGPKMRVPRGFWCVVDDDRGVLVEADVGAVVAPCSLLGAHDDRATTSPFLTAPLGIACLTVPTMTSPTAAYRRREPPSTRMHRISRGAGVVGDAQSCSATWITSAPSRGSRRAASASARQRTALDDAHQVADGGLVVLVVGVQLGRACAPSCRRPGAGRDVSTRTVMVLSRGRRHHERPGGDLRGATDSCGVRAARGSPSARSRSCATVRMPRDLAPRRAPSSEVRSSAPDACWKRRLKCASRAVSRVRASSSSDRSLHLFRLHLLYHPPG